MVCVSVCRRIAVASKHIRYNEQDIRAREQIAEDLPIVVGEISPPEEGTWLKDMLG